MHGSKGSTHHLTRRHILQALALLPIAACNATPLLGNVSRSLKIAAAGFDDADVGQAYVDQLPYASVLVKIGSGPRSLLVLSARQKDTLTYAGADRTMMIIQHGRIMQTVGLDGKDLSRLHYPNDPLPMLAAQGWPDTAQIKGILDYRGQDLFGIPINSTLEKRGLEEVMILERRHTLQRYDETCHCPLLDWDFRNRWWLDPKTGFVWQSWQHVHPQLPVVELAVTKVAG